MKTKQLDDTTLVQLAQKGDTSAFEELIKRYEDKIFSLAYRILQNKDDAYDVLQETAISAFKNLNRFQGRSAFSTWLTRIALNFALMRKRKQKSIQKKAQIVSAENNDKIHETVDIQDLQNLVDWSENPVASLESKEIVDILQRSLNQLPEKYRTVFILKELEGKPIEEIAQILNLTTSAVKTRLHRGRLYLRELLDKYLSQGLI